MYTVNYWLDDNWDVFRLYWEFMGASSWSVNIKLEGENFFFRGKTLRSMKVIDWRRILPSDWRHFDPSEMVWGWRSNPAGSPQPQPNTISRCSPPSKTKRNYHKDLINYIQFRFIRRRQRQRDIMTQLNMLLANCNSIDCLIPFW